MPRGLGLVTATTCAAFFRQFEQRSRSARALSVIDQPTRRARASGSISREKPYGQLTRASNWLKTPALREWCEWLGPCVHTVPASIQTVDMHSTCEEPERSPPASMPADPSSIID
jgi:hypothetical protein